MSGMVNADMSEFWNGEGGEKWLRFQDKMDASLKPLGQAAMAVAGFSAGWGVIDVGCGCGDTSIEIARRVGHGGHVHGIDISRPILARAKERAEYAAAENVVFECGDAQTHGFAPATFDAVFSRFGVMFFEDPVSAFRNVRRALRPGGRLTFICWQSAKENQWVTVPLDLVANHVTLPEPPGPEEPGPLSFGDSARVMRILTDAGFSGTKIERFETSFTVGRNLEETVEFLTQMGPAGSAISRSDADDTVKSRIADDLRDVLAPYETESGIVMDAATWIVTARNP